MNPDRLTRACHPSKAPNSKRPSDNLVWYDQAQKSKAVYQDYLTLWKDADSDIPIFIPAKAEYAKLH